MAAFDPNSFDPDQLHMSADEFRARGHAMVDWIARYLETVEDRPVESRAEPGSIRAQLPASAPSAGESFDAMMEDVDQIIMPGLTHWQSPGFFGYFPANTSGPSILGELLSAGLGVQGMIWATSPACTELETHVLDWLVEMLGLPEKFDSRGGSGSGVIQDTASSSSLCALLAARERVTEFAVNAHGVDRPMCVYTSDQAHSSIEKGARIAGIGTDHVRLIPTDERFAMRVDALRDAVEADRRAGRTPFFISATTGTTGSNGMDPLRAIGAVAQEFGLWFHVDAAMSGTAALCPEFRHVQDGLELADSYTFNPHKWMFTNFDCNCFYVAQKDELIRTLTILPEYLRNRASESGAVTDYRDWHIPLGRRFRALKLWFVIRHYGVEGLRALIRHHVALAQSFAAAVRDDDAFELTMDPPLNLVCFHHVRGDEFTEALHHRLNDSGRIFLTHAKLGDRYTLRMSIGGSRMTRRHIDAAWSLIRQTAAELESAGP